MVTRILSLLFISSLCCFGQAYTLRDQAFLGSFLNSTNSPFLGCPDPDINLLAYWKMDEGGTNQIIQNYSSYGSIFTAALVGTGEPAWTFYSPTFPWMPSRNAYAPMFPAGNSLMNCGEGINGLFKIITNQYSITLWTIRTNNTVLVDLETAICGKGRLSGTLFFRFGIRNSDNRYFFEDTGGGVNGPTAASIPSSTPVFWSLVRNNNGYSMWKNGVIQAFQPGTTYGDQAGDCTITVGNDTTAHPRNWRGTIEEVRIYKNRGLSSNDVWCLYSKFYGPP